MNYQTLKKTLAKIRHIPLHPQWLVYRNEHEHYRQIGKQVAGIVLDIGCADQFAKTYLQNPHYYIGLDYHETATWYATQPMIYGDAQQLSFANNSIDAVLLLDVLEHLPRPEDCFGEVTRVLKPNGIFIVQVPFLYPIHDAPRDFQRWTQYGLQQLVNKYGFVIRQQYQIGEPLETAGLLLNIALAKTTLNWLQQKNPLVILSILMPVVILGINLLCRLFSLLSSTDPMMPHSYCLVLEKK